MSSLHDYTVQFRAKRDTDTQIAPVVNSSNAPTLSSSAKQNPKTLPDDATTTPQLLGVNGTGQRKDYSIPGATVNKAAGSVLLAAHAPAPASTSSPNAADAKPKINVTSNPGILSPDDDDFNDKIDESDEAFNKTRDEFSKGLTQKDDYWVYYNSSSIVDPVRAKELYDSFQNHTVSSLLSKSHRRAIVSFFT